MANKLWSLAGNGYIDIAKFLLRQGLSVGVSTSHLRASSAWCERCECIHQETIHTLESSLLYSLSKPGVFESETGRVLLVPMQARLEVGATPLHVAGRRYGPKGHSMVDRDHKRSFCLCFSAMYGQPRMIELLIQKGSEIDVPDKRQRTPLYYATHNAELEAVIKLLAMGADPLQKDEDGYTPRTGEILRPKHPMGLNCRCLQLPFDSGGATVVQKEYGPDYRHPQGKQCSQTKMVIVCTMR
jgi:hypothetical protein